MITWVSLPIFYSGRYDSCEPEDERWNLQPVDLERSEEYFSIGTDCQQRWSSDGRVTYSYCFLSKKIRKNEKIWKWSEERKDDNEVERERSWNLSTKPSKCAKEDVVSLFLWEHSFYFTFSHDGRNGKQLLDPAVRGRGRQRLLWVQNHTITSKHSPILLVWIVSLSAQVGIFRLTSRSAAPIRLEQASWKKSENIFSEISVQSIWMWKSCSRPSWSEEMRNAQTSLF